MSLWSGVAVPIAKHSSRVYLVGRQDKPEKGELRRHCKGGDLERVYRMVQTNNRDRERQQRQKKKEAQEAERDRDETEAGRNTKMTD